MANPTNNDDLLVGTFGADVIFGLGGNDTLDGGAGDDRLYGQAGDDTSYGGDGEDLIQSDVGNDTLDGGAGDDRLYGEAGDDTSYGGDGNDLIQSGLDNDTLYGGAGSDELYGEAGHDQSFGGDGDDLIFSGDGNDTLDGGAGADELYGGAGDDYFVVDNLSEYVLDNEGVNTGLVTVDFYKQAKGVQWTLAEGVKALPYWIDSLVFSGSEYIDAQKSVAEGVIKYAFPTEVLASWNDDDKLGFTPLNDVQKAFIQKIFSYIETLINIQFELVTDATQPGVLTFANNQQDDSAGYATGGLSFSKWGIFFSNSSNSAAGNADPNDGEYAAYVYIHEIGHALGLKHPHNETVGGFSAGEGPYLDQQEDRTTFTQLSYTAFRQDFISEFRDFDIASLQYLYGPAQTPGSSNNQTGSNTYALLTNQRNFIWDGGGTDTLDASAASMRIVLSLEVGDHSYFGNVASQFITSAGQVTINIGTLIENAIGTAFDDVITGNEAANAINGHAGNDVIAGYLGNDTLDGGGGTDTAVYSAIRAQTAISRGAGGLITITSGIDGTDTLSGFEFIRFADQVISLRRFDDPGAPRVANFTVGAGGWSSQDRFPRQVADVNGDGLADIVGFGQAGALVSLGQANGTFANP
ncbi:MAG: hypothetical protein B7Y89_15345, partial [Novosphingobium sp. 32-60-15]